MEIFEKAFEKGGVDSRLGETTESEVIGAASRIIHDTEDQTENKKLASLPGY